MAKIVLSTGFSVEVKPTPLLGLHHALERISMEQEAKMPECPEWEVKSATGSYVKVPYSPPSPGKEPTPDKAEEYEMFQRWRRYAQERGRIEADLERKTRQITLRYALTHSVSGVRVPARKQTGLGCFVWFILRLLDVLAAKLSGQPVPPADWEGKALYFGLDWDNEIERRLAYFYSVVIGAALDADLILAAATLMGPPERSVKRAKRLFPDALGSARTDEAAGGTPGMDTEGPDEFQPMETLGESGPGQPDDADRVPRARRN